MVQDSAEYQPQRGIVYTKFARFTIVVENIKKSLCTRVCLHSFSSTSRVSESIFLLSFVANDRLPLTTTRARAGGVGSSAFLWRPSEQRQMHSSDKPSLRLRKSFLRGALNLDTGSSVI